MRDYGRKYRKPDLSFSGDTRQRLLGYSWPGNVRELQHTVEKAVIMCDRQVLTPEDFLFKSEPGEMAPLETLEDMEREMIRKAWYGTRATCRPLPAAWESPGKPCTTR